jgi:tryptophan-rich sensory protein
MLLFLVPLVLSALTQTVFPTHPTKKFTTLHFQPPGYVFGIVWTLLYLLLGVYMSLLNPQERLLRALFIANMVLNLAWMPVVTKYDQVQTGIFMIAAMLAITGFMLIHDSDKARRSLLVPYMTWLLVAILLNVELSRTLNKTVDKSDTFSVPTFGVRKGL